MRGPARILSALALLLVVTACSGDQAEDPQSQDPRSEKSQSEKPKRDKSGSPATVGTDTELRDELEAMLEEDQAERADDGEFDDEDRVARLKEIVDEHGWPTHDLVGTSGATAAWAIALHADSDLEFQRQALGLLRDAVEADQGSKTHLAYLDDRVAVAAGERQTYGTRLKCSPDGPTPRTEIKDRAGLDDRRKKAGLTPYEEFVQQIAKLCES